MEQSQFLLHWRNESVRSKRIQKGNRRIQSFKGRVLLVFPSGAKIDNASQILEGDYKDGRRIIVFKDKADAV